MKKVYEFLTVLFILSIFIFNNAQAQYELNKHYVGPEIGFIFGSSTLQFGANYEYALRIEDFGDFGVGGVFRYWNYGDAYWSYTDIVIGAQGNYHLKMKNKKLDVWTGLILGYDFGSWNYDGPNSNWVEPTYGGLLLTFNGGGRYWFSPEIAVTGRLGFGTLSYGSLELGIDFKL